MTKCRLHSNISTLVLKVTHEKIFKPIPGEGKTYVKQFRKMCYFHFKRSILISLRNSNSMEISPCCNPVTGLQMVTHFCTCHNNPTVVSCAKFCCDEKKTKCPSILNYDGKHFRKIGSSSEFYYMNKPISQIPECISSISHNAPFRTEICTFLFWVQHCGILGFMKSLQWRQNEHDGVSNHRCLDCLFNKLFRRRSKKTSKLRVTGLCAGNSPVTGEFTAQRASNAKNVPIWWRHHEIDCQIIYLLVGVHGILPGFYLPLAQSFWSSGLPGPEMMLNIWRHGVVEENIIAICHPELMSPHHVRPKLAFVFMAQKYNWKIQRSQHVVLTWSHCQQGSWGQHGAHLGPTGPRWVPCWPHELCHLG